MGLEGKAILDRVSIMKKQTEGEIIKMSINRRIDKLCFIHKMKYNSVIKKEPDLLQHSRSIDKSHRRNAQQEKLDAKEYMT